MSGTVRVLQCPGDRSTGVNPEGQSVRRPRSMSMNCWVGGPGFVDSSQAPSPNPTDWKHKVCAKMGDLLDTGPSGTFVFIDEREDSIDNGYFAQGMAGYPDRGAQWSFWNVPASYHNKAGS